MADLIIFGTGDYAAQAHYYLTTDSPHRVAGFCVSRDWLRSDAYLDLPVVAFETVQDRFPPDRYRMFLPMSGRRMNRLRQEFYHAAKDKGYRLVSYISSRALLCDNPVGENCMILENANLQPFDSVGDDTIIWNATHIGHHSRIGSHVFISANVTVSGRCVVGDNCYLSAGAVIDADVELARGTLAGLASVVLRDTRPWGIYTGHPARKRKPSSRDFEFLK